MVSMPLTSRFAEEPSDERLEAELAKAAKGSSLDDSPLSVLSAALSAAVSLDAGLLDDGLLDDGFEPAVF